jgi:hypothetical protein
LNRAARLMSVAHGGQIVVSGDEHLDGRRVTRRVGLATWRAPAAIWAPRCRCSKWCIPIFQGFRLRSMTRRRKSAGRRRRSSAGTEHRCVGGVPTQSVAVDAHRRRWRGEGQLRSGGRRAAADRGRCVAVSLRP